MGQDPEKSPLEEGVEDVEEEVDINSYHDPSGLTVSKLDAGLWYVENKDKMRNSVFIALLAIGALFWMYFILQFSSYIVTGISLERKIVREILAQNLPPTSFYREPGIYDLELLPVRVLNASGQKKDFIGQVSNPNQRHWARFKYSFNIGGQKLSEKQGFVLPGQKKMLLDLGRAAANTSGVVLLIEQIEWGRANPHDFGRWDDFYEDHMEFEFSQINFIDGDDSSLSEKLALNNLSFQVANKSDFNYWNVPLIISLYNYNDLVSIGTYEVNDFEADSLRNVNFTWPGNFPNISKIEVVPDLDVTRLDIYKDFKSSGSIFR